MPSLFGEASCTQWAVLWESQGQDEGLGFHPWLGLQWRRDLRQVLVPSRPSLHWEGEGDELEMSLVMCSQLPSTDPSP